jgi:hypothetical protein
MKFIILILLFFIITANYSCSDEGIAYAGLDSVQWTPNITVQKYNPRIPSLDYQPESTELPNEYQNKSQLFIDSTVSMCWSDAGFKNGNAAIKFYQNLQLNIKFNEKEAIANLIDFPLRDKLTKADFLKNYDRIFHKEFKRELLEQNPFELYRNKNGCMAGNDGQLWFKPEGKSYRIFELNYNF